MESRRLWRVRCAVGVRGGFSRRGVVVHGEAREFDLKLCCMWSAVCVVSFSGGEAVRTTVHPHSEAPPQHRKNTNTFCRYFGLPRTGCQRVERSRHGARCAGPPFGNQFGPVVLGQSQVSPSTTKISDCRLTSEKRRRR